MLFASALAMRTSVAERWRQENAGFGSVHDVFLPNIFLPNPSSLSSCFVRPKDLNGARTCLPAKPVSDNLLPRRRKPRRVSPTAYARDSLKEVLELAERTAAVTHNHPDGILGALAVAGCIYVARDGGTKDDIRRFIDAEIGYDLSKPLDMIRPFYSFDVSCVGSVPHAVTAFLESESVEHAIRLAVSLGGDADTQACIAGAIAEPLFRRCSCYTMGAGTRASR